MSVFEATINVSNVAAEVIEDESGKKFAANLVLGVQAFAPVGPNQLLPIPIGLLRAPFDKQSLKNLITHLQEAHDQLDEHSDIAIATDLSTADRIAQSQKGLR